MSFRNQNPLEPNPTIAVRRLSAFVPDGEYPIKTVVPTPLPLPFSSQFALWYPAPTGRMSVAMFICIALAI